MLCVGICLLVKCQCHVEVTWSCVVFTQCCQVLSVTVCVTLTGCQEVVTRMRVLLARWCQMLSVGVCVTLTVCHEVT